MDEPTWERCLRERFPAYLLRNAAGEPRSLEAVEAALRRLQGTPGALVRLAELGFLLDPQADLLGFLEERLPRWLERVLPETVRRQDVRHGSFRGRVDWPRTLELRRRTRDASWFVGTRPQRTFATPPLLALRWLLEQVLQTIEDIRPARLEAERGLVKELSRLHGAARLALGHAALRELPVERPAWQEPEGGRRELYVDAKNATNVRYLVESHLKMLGYIADRPGAFGTAGTKVVLVSPLPVTGRLRAEDEVVFVSAEDCSAGSTLERAIWNWLRPEARSTVRAL